MAIVIESVQSSIGAGDQTIATTVGSGQILVACIGIHQGNVVGVTYNGSSLTQGPNAATVYNERAEIWYDLAPSVGTYNLIFDGTGGGGRFLCSMVLSGVKTSGQPAQTANNNGDSAYSSVNITPTTDNNLIIDCHYSEPVPTIDTGTEKANLQANSYENGAVSIYEQATAALQAMGWNLSYGGRWANVALSFEPASTSYISPMPAFRRAV